MRTKPLDRKRQNGYNESRKRVGKRVLTWLKKSASSENPQPIFRLRPVRSIRFRTAAISILVYSYAEESGLIQGFVFDSPRYFDSIGLPPLFRTKTFIGKDAVLSRICEAIQEEYVNQSAFHETALNALTTEFVIRLYRNYGEKNLEVAGIAVPNAGEARNFGKQRVVREALAYIYENCQDGISTRDIARHVNVSLSYLCRCFSEVCGETVLSYSDRIRCRKAHEDLTLGTLSVGEIAAKYHFSSLSYFNRRYRKFYGTNPAATLADAKMRHRR